MEGEIMDTKDLLAERGKTHGDFGEHALVTQNIKYAMQGSGCISTVSKNWDALKPYQAEALEMIAHKIGRILAGNSNFRDHWDDIAGYARLVAERCPHD
jgi:hypothetical protein